MGPLGSNATQTTRVTAEVSRTSTRRSGKAISASSPTGPDSSSKATTLGKSSKCLSSVGVETREEEASTSVLIRARMQREAEDVAEASEEAGEVPREAEAADTSSLPKRGTMSNCTPTSTA